MNVTPLPCPQTNFSALPDRISIVLGIAAMLVFVAASLHWKEEVKE